MLSLQSKYFFYENDNGLEGMKTRGKRQKAVLFCWLFVCVYSAALCWFSRYVFYTLDLLFYRTVKPNLCAKKSGERPRYKQQGQCSTVQYTVLLSILFWCDMIGLFIELEMLVYSRCTVTANLPG